MKSQLVLPGFDADYVFTSHQTEDGDWFAMIVLNNQEVETTNRGYDTKGQALKEARRIYNYSIK